MGISMPIQQYLVLNSGGVVTVPAVSSELVEKEPARIVVMASEGKEIEQSITRTIGRSSITIIRRQEEDVMKIPPPVDTVIVQKEVKSLDSMIKTLSPYERGSIERRGMVGAWGDGEADRLLDQTLDSRLSTIEVLQNTSMVMEKGEANVEWFHRGEAEEWNVGKVRAAQKEKRRVEAEQQEERKKQKAERVRVELERRDERRKADAERVVRSRTEWLRKKEEMKLKEDQAKKEVDELRKKELEKKAGGEKRLADIKKVAFHRDKYLEAREKMLFHMGGYAKMSVDLEKGVDLEDFYPSKDKAVAKTLSKRAKEFGKKTVKKTKPEDKLVQDKPILITKAELKNRQAEKGGLEKEKKSEEKEEAEVVELWLAGQEKVWEKLE